MALLSRTKPAAPPASPNGAAPGTPRKIVTPAGSPTRRRRRPALIALAVALTAVGALAALWLVSTVGDRVPVLAVAQPVALGERIEAADLIAAQVSTDPALQPLPVSALDTVVGQRAAVALLPGTLLTADQITTRVIPGPGEQLVPITLPGSRLPAEPLVAGDTVLVVPTPQINGDPPETEPDTIEATVVSVGGTDRNGLVTIDLLVDPSDGTMLAAQAATTRVALVLQPRGDG